MEKVKNQWISELSTAAKPLQEYLEKHHNPMTIACVDCSGVTVLCAEAHVPTKKAANQNG